MTDDLATWLRTRLDALADSHRAVVLAEGQNPDHEQDADPDGFWALHEAHSRILHLWRRTYEQATRRHPDVLLLADGMLKAIAVAHHHADGYREAWRP